MSIVKPVLAFLIRDLKSIFRSPSTLFWVIGYPVLLLLMTVFIWVPPSQPAYTVKVAITTYPEYSENITSMLAGIMENVTINNTSLFKVTIVKNESAGLELLRSGKVDALLVFPSNLWQILSGLAYFNNTSKINDTIKVYVLSSGTKTQIVSSIIQGFLDKFSLEAVRKRLEITAYYAEKYGSQYVPEEYKKQFNLWVNWVKLLGTPLNYTIRDVRPKGLLGAFNNRAAILGWMLIGLIGVQTLFIGLIVSSSSIVEEKENGTLTRIIASPIKPLVLLIAITAGVMISIALSTIAIIVVGLGLGAYIPFNPVNPYHWLSILYIILGILFVIGLGLTIGMFVRRTSAASTISFIIAFPAMFTTGVWWPPKEFLPGFMKTLATYSPLTQALDGARQILVYGATGSEALAPLPYTILAAIVMYAIGVQAFKISLKKNLLQ